MPTGRAVPNVTSELVEMPARTNPLGIKGIGESGTIGAPPTVVNAVTRRAAPTRGRAHRYATDARPSLGCDPGSAATERAT